MSEPLDPGLEPAAPETTEPSEPVWSGPSQEDWENTQAALGYIVQQMQPPPQQQQALDPFSDNYQQQLDAYIDQRLAPMQAVTHETVMSRAEEQAMDILGGYVEQHGDFLLPDSLAKARALANDYLPETQRQYGYGPRAAEAALRMGYDAVKAWERKVGEPHHQQQLGQLRNIGQARREPPPAGVNGSGQQLITSENGDERSVLAKYFPN